VSELWQRKCEACAPGTPPIEESRAKELHSKVERPWGRETNKQLTRSFKFRNFRDAFGFASRIALLAESEGHHPDLEIGWGRVEVSLTTHVAGGLTDNDFIMAAKIDRLTRGTGIKDS